MSKEHREGAAYFGSLSTFRKQFSHVVFLDLRVTAAPFDFPNGCERVYRYSLQNPPGERCPCPNPACDGGGLDLGSELERLIHERKESGEWSGHCDGSEKVRGSSRSCCYFFKATVEIKYHAEETENEVNPD